MRRRVHVFVRGRVQGVGYRYTLRMTAEAAGVGGWTRNLADGRVEAEIEGTAAQVDDVLGWMADGPPGARVAGIEVAEAPPAGDTAFEVRPSG